MPKLKADFSLLELIAIKIIFRLYKKIFSEPKIKIYTF